MTLALKEFAVLEGRGICKKNSLVTGVVIGFCHISEGAGTEVSVNERRLKVGGWGRRAFQKRLCREWNMT